MLDCRFLASLETLKILSVFPQIDPKIRYTAKLIAGSFSNLNLFKFIYLPIAVASAHASISIGAD